RAGGQPLGATRLDRRVPLAGRPEARGRLRRPGALAPARLPQLSRGADDALQTRPQAVQRLDREADRLVARAILVDVRDLDAARHQRGERRVAADAAAGTPAKTRGLGRRVEILRILAHQREPEHLLETRPRFGVLEARLGIDHQRQLRREPVRDGSQVFGAGLADADQPRGVPQQPPDRRGRDHGRAGDGRAGRAIHQHSATVIVPVSPLRPSWSMLRFPHFGSAWPFAGVAVSVKLDASEPVVPAAIAIVYEALAALSPEKVRTPAVVRLEG